MPTPPGDSHDAKATDPAAGHISFAAFIAGIRSGVAQMSVRTGAAVVALPLASVAYFAVPFS